VLRLRSCLVPSSFNVMAPFADPYTDYTIISINLKAGIPFAPRKTREDGNPERTASCHMARWLMCCRGDLFFTYIL
jgi:hypothetical protein